MIKLYVSPSCSSCRKVKKWFEENHIPFQEINIFNAVLNKNELKEMLIKSENGTDDIISPRSKIIKEQHINFDDMTMNELLEFIQNNPSILKRPIMVDDRKIQVGYNEEEIRTFIPRAKKIAETNCSPDCCERYPFCEHIKATFPKTLEENSSSHIKKVISSQDK